MPFYIVAVGSNINAQVNIHQAFELIEKIDSQASMATLLSTEPVGFTEQADFTNTAFSFDCVLNATDLKAHLKIIENQLGRVRTSNKNGPRPIDLDIVKIDNDIVDDDYHQYDFVKKSVDELVSKRAMKNK
ncbi:MULTISPECIES: 2-amino-4-hydroxy-6-hydroxymethyldihydropteridine diphosphokinase [Colwellia]|uniref:2-amino-4-hydroxy-6-hydroxymethyldihydropteridine pyrophosphokinase n=1 Tax=Colwellia psychrerythraea (strain 34H / ATCC BAA-681) TaxID=167879 RepID=Q480Y0_COLP3|nr:MULTISPECIES: 2-amino-4-hydroxy-6-hydroxymethyldihydropteridine diphosphokinase [Colwellia]AAZ27446.1 2-amino-4-hydroxy-6-hydroxymethyldihydropteridine pyrophosphokinase [Colwellia psychrerythraea 34H]PKH87650.1 2-amino-4-hydroxy-6-hydroxymethyldihydropteridine diphosphokinase [Colwellia sp. Bg11-28]